MIFRLTGLLALAAGVIGCGVNEIDSVGGAGGKGDTAGGVPAIRCTVKVSRHGVVDVEEEYIPRVAWCELTAYQQSPELLRAQAVAARTFLYSELSYRSSVTNGEGDQVYKTPRCSGAIPREYRDAARDTRGLVMLKPDGSLHHGFYRAGSYACGAYPYECFDEPCLGQKQAAACAAEGWLWQDLLDLFYDTPIVVRATGECPPFSPWGACARDGVEGICLDVDTSSCDGGSFVPSLCAGPANVQCCLGAPAAP